MTLTHKLQPENHQRGFFGNASWLLVLGAILLAVFYMGSAQSHGKGFGGKRGPGGIEARIEHMMEQVGVSDAQRTQIRSVMDSQRSKFRDVHDRVRTARKALHALDPMDAGYDTEVQRLAAEIGQGSGDMVVLMADGRKQIWQLLTEEQRAEAEKLMQERREKFRERHFGKPGSEE